MKYLKMYENFNNYQVGDMVVLINPDGEDRRLGFKKNSIYRITNIYYSFDTYPYEIELSPGDEKRTNVSKRNICKATQLDIDQLKYNL